MRTGLTRSPSVYFLVYLLVLFLRMHRFSRVGHREPSVPSNIWNEPTLYEGRDAMCEGVIEREPSMEAGGLKPFLKVRNERQGLPGFRLQRNANVLTHFPLLGRRAAAV